MYATVVENLIVRHSAARFAGTQGYRLEGDQAHLNAAVAVEDGGVVGDDWALQLWACEQGELRGIKVAELPVGSLPAAGAASLGGWATALPPAGHGTHTMILALASGGVGQFNRIHDLTVFPRPERFCQPSLEGTVGYRFDRADVELSVGAVANPRNTENLSGSLSLELWTLTGEYEGGAFEGFRIAGAELGCLAGQDRLEDVRRTLPAQPIPAGSWRVVLMLREWTPAGFVTRDYATFSGPLVVAEPVSAELGDPTGAASSPSHTDGGKTEQAVAGLQAKTGGLPQTKPKAPAATAKVSINRATVAELAALKGLSKTVAAAIVAARPYDVVNEVLRAKGMGPKLLEKLRDQLAL